MTPRRRKLSLAGIAVLAAAGLGTGASGAMADEGQDRSEVRYVVDEGSGQDCPGHDGATDAGSEL
ncbi:hypothetical protein AB0M28_22115 [Streptomyces sp. NPDC051940]|uniref:hypothetical protein n=1 Tax=Streptomyces sp. NPDC051940 TaxID=3155675 RepID=UPI003448B942